MKKSLLIILIVLAILVVAFAFVQKSTSPMFSPEEVYDYSGEFAEGFIDGSFDDGSDGFDDSSSEVSADDGGGMEEGSVSAGLFGSNSPQDQYEEDMAREETRREIEKEVGEILSTDASYKKLQSELESLREAMQKADDEIFACNEEMARLNELNEESGEEGAAIEAKGEECRQKDIAAVNAQRVFQLKSDEVVNHIRGVYNTVVANHVSLLSSLQDLLQDVKDWVREIVP